MTDKSDRVPRSRLLRDVAVFQIKLGMEAVLDITLIPVSLAAAALDLVLGNWRQPRWFHAVLRFGERCEQQDQPVGRRVARRGHAAIGRRCTDAQHREPDPSTGHCTGQGA